MVMDDVGHDVTQLKECDVCTEYMTERESEH
jgi:hypothetical protein